MALVDDQPRMASALATMGTTIIIVSREVFNDKLRKTDPFIRGLLSIFVGSIRTRN
jgi:CRP-like cAMP-binding protein